MDEDSALDLIDDSPGELEPVGAEGEDDLDALDPKTLSQAVVFATDWTAETILRQLERGNIQMNPKYQRRDAWRGQRKSRFIESVFLGLPIPQIVLAEAKSKRGSYIVIDGKQRLLTIRQFAAQKDDTEYDQLKLSGLEIRKDLQGKSLLDLEKDPSSQADVAAFQNQTIRTVVLRNWPNENFLYLVFLRLNTGSVQLSPQELRQALHPGPFIDFVIERSGNSDGLKRLLKSKQPDFRMRDVELLVRYYAFRNFLPEYTGSLKAFLDGTCKVLNQEWDHRKSELESQAREFELALGATFSIFGANACRKSDGEQYEARLNRAVFDIMVYYFSFVKIRDAAVAKANDVEKAFRAICQGNSGFIRSIEATTKSLLATESRLRIWGEALSRVLQITVSIPKVGPAN